MSDSLQIGTPRGVPLGPAAYRGGMARIRRQSQGQPAVVVLSDLDRELLAQALDAYVYTSGLPAAKVAAQLGVARPYLYRLISAEHIEVERLIKLQGLLGIYLLSEGEVEEYVNSLRSELLGRPINDSWFKDSPYIEVSLYYVAWHLIGSLRKYLKQVEGIDAAQLDRVRERRLTIEFAWEDSQYHLRKLYEYCSTIVQALDAELMEDDRWTENEIRIKLPVVGCRDYWLDFEEEVSEIICDYHFDLSNDAKKFDDNDPAVIAALGEDDLLPWIQEELDEKLAYHEKFCKTMLAKIDELASNVEQIEQLCETRERALRRTSYRLSELHEVADNLENNSFLLTPKHKKSIVEWLAVHQPSIELLSEDNWWARRSEFRCRKCGTVYSYNFRYLIDGIGPCQCSAELNRKALE
jgi:hypothetical protein